MALVDTLACQGPMEFSNICEVARAIKMALVDELSADTTYEKIAEGARNGGFLVAETEEFIEATLIEIMDDERKHQGKLLSILTRIDEDYANRLAEGSTEEEA